eukprot:CAMPEP_0169479584 /NCGR_PEP_ID=MMETSP1042-20121227/29101_1 /TAXON_ID=464988 /ORGANISM="Hemiselmis andersenii, Strain CCMP1180" /LENGTH=78 /DNA_ID=CAMNT_0009594157 /DNA_START=140 /DNA_END=372 /DNA_ORIENTATION=+
MVTLLLPSAPLTLPLILFASSESATAALMAPLQNRSNTECSGFSVSTTLSPGFAMIWMFRNTAELPLSTIRPFDPHDT